MAHIETAYGVLDVPSWKDDLIVRSLTLHGEWGLAEAELFASLITEEDFVWDVGAFLGTFSMGLGIFREPKRILAIEANMSLKGYLDTNLQRNLSCELGVLFTGVGREDGWLVPANEEDSYNHGARTYHSVLENVADSVPCRSLTSLRGQVGSYDAIKLDIEGMEREVLLGDFPYLKARKPLIWAECNATLGSIELLKILKSLDYDPLYVAFPAFRENNFNGASDLIHPMVYEAALVGAPPDRVAHFVERLDRRQTICRFVGTALDLRKALFDTPRWCKPEWLSMNRAELVARLGRAHAGHRIETFLADRELPGGK